MGSAKATRLRLSVIGQHQKRGQKGVKKGQLRTFVNAVLMAKPNRDAELADLLR